ncbi:fatty acid hydroxylase domain-containing protein 2-like [Lytechinus pictus]|uniref:fatty acid hydroxylase domain-containing protein 2-like n=1 Tax=Lytechinus pictus TaxID=7653 RepID=UPI0030BA0EAB
MGNRNKENGVYLERNNDKSKSSSNDQASLSTAIMSILGVMFAIFCVAFRSTLLHHGQSLWFASGNFIARQWGVFYDYFDGNLAKMGIALHCVFVLEYWLLGGLFLITDLTGKPKFIRKYKVQLDETEIPGDKLRRTLWTVFLNHTIYSAPILICHYYAGVWRGCVWSVHDLPTLPTLIIQLVIFAIVEEFGFYYSHRMLHLPFFYKPIHKQHHEWIAPIGFVTSYAHPFENFISNMLPAITSSLLIGSHLLTYYFWIIQGQYISIVHHSGYHLPLLPSPEFHDYHHLKFTNNYGVLGLLDWFHGTDVNYKKSKQFLRHKTLYGITPISQLIPDDKN